jgi:hypothetical protein
MMTMHKWIELDGKRYRWKDILRIRREQEKENRQAKQPALFETFEDSRPVTQRTASDRYRNPTLFKID